MCGYYNNMKFDSWRCEDDNTCWFYEWYGENDDGEDMHGCEPGLPMAIRTIIDQIKEKPISYNWIFNQMPQKYILDDECRNKNIEYERQRLIDCAFDSYMRQDLYEWIDKNNPCKKCTINEHDHWNDICYNCELCHTHSCEIANAFEKEQYKRTREVSDKIKSLSKEEKEKILNSEEYKIFLETKYMKN